MLFVFGNTPNPVHLERAQLVAGTGKYDVYYAFWRRHMSDITIPMGGNFDKSKLIGIDLPDPRGNKLRRAFLTLKFCFRLRQVVRKLRPSLVYALNVNMAANVKIAELGIRKKPNLVLEFQDQFGTKLSRLERLIYLWSISRVKYTVIQSKANLNYLEQNRLLEKTKPYTFIPPSPTDDKVLKVGENEQNLKKADGLSIGYFGYLLRAGVLETLVNSCLNLAKSNRKINLIFAGEGPAAKAIEKLSKEHSFIKFYGPYEYFSGYRKLFGMADLLYAVYPKEQTNAKFAIARRFTEAVVAKKPLVVQKKTHMASLIERHGGGFCVDGTNQKEVEKLLGMLSTDPSNLEKIDGAMADDELTNYMDFKTHQAQFLGLFDKFCT